MPSLLVALVRFNVSPLASAVRISSTSTASLMTMLQQHRTIDSLRTALSQLDRRSVKVGFVPTMGALHDGHASLVRQARLQNDVVVASIFVNPTQFAPHEDLDKYPRSLGCDTDLLESLGVDHLFLPDASTMYGPNHVTYVDPEGFDDTVEGNVRPGHFRGVATIVTKLFNIVRPDQAYFGQKDAAQCVLIRRIVNDLDMSIDIHVLETIREADGLAMSSRNTYLSPTERTAAAVLYQSLRAAQELFLNTSAQAQTSASSSTLSIPSATIQDTVTSILRSEPLVGDIQYVSIDCRETMRPLSTVLVRDGAIVSLACKVGKVRLIDNVVLHPRSTRSGDGTENLSSGDSEKRLQDSLRPR